MATSAGASTDDRADPSSSAMQARVDDVRDAGAVGVLAQVRHGRAVWKSTSGVSAIGGHRPVSPQSRYRAGSITKTFLSTVVLQLVAEGRIGLDDPVEDWLPGTIPGGDEIAVRHLLGHTSGLADYRRTLSLPPSQQFIANRWRTWTAAELVQRAAALPRDFDPPGSRFAYSNTNYTLLGMIVEAATGRSYGHEITERLIRPLHLTRTSMPGTNPSILGPSLRGYAPLQPDPTSDRLVLVDFTAVNPSLFGAGGELISTNADLERFFSALLGGRLLTPELLDAMLTPSVTGGRYGLGLTWRETACGVRVYGHDGDVVSYQAYSFTTLDQQHRATIALTPDFSGDPDDAVDAFFDEAFCGSPS
ncbi:beta-lactamase family protein [Mumia zhuanghuii]|nr:beta-lactamase family protein [Mumia zhuanghuii]